MMRQPRIAAVDQRVPHEHSWFYRRVTVFSILLFCAVGIIYLVHFGEDDELRNTIAMGLITMGITIATGYIFGAVWDDRNLTNAKVREHEIQYSPGYMNYMSRYGNMGGGGVPEDVERIKDGMYGEG